MPCPIPPSRSPQPSQAAISTPNSADRPPANLQSTRIRARTVASVTSSPPSAILAPSIGGFGLTGQHKCHIHRIENVTLTPKEQTRLQVLNSLLDEYMTLDQAATLMGVTTRHTRRILAAYREQGVAAVAHDHRGRKPANATPDTVIADVVHLAKTKYEGANHTHLRELLSERDGIAIGRTTLRRILLDAGLTSPRRRRPPKHRVRRQRMPRQGMLIQMDGSHHRWLGDQAPPFALLIAVDDATGTVVDALFCEQEDAHSYFVLIQGLVQHLGVPVALYTDRHAVFRHTPGSGLPGMPTQFSRAMEELGIQMIFAISPQAKGRMERMAGTFQDRLVTELRLAGATTIEQANSVLEQFLPRYNRRFQVSPQHPEPAFRSLNSELCLDQILCFKHRRRVARDNTVKFQLHTLQLLPGTGTPQLCRCSGGGSWKDWTAGSRCGTKGTSLLPRRHHPVRYFSETATGVSQLLRSCHPAPTAWANTGQRLANRWTQGQRTRTAHGMITDGVARADQPVVTSARKLTFLQRERWKAIQKARRKGMSLRAIERELGIHRGTIRKYLDAQGPPTRQSTAAPTASSSDTIAA